MDDAVVLNLGQPWPQDYFRVPDDFPTFGWQMSGNSPFLVVGDPDGVMTEHEVATAPVRLGFTTFGPLVICMMKCPALPATMVESPRPFIIGDPPPEITIEKGDHILWQMVTVSRGIILNMRAFTTSPQVTVWLRRAFAEQRANGPISYAESDHWIARWREATPTEREAWKRVEVSSKGGD